MSAAVRPPLPPFETLEAAARKVRLAEDAWNSRDPEAVALAYTPDSEWRNRDTFLTGRPAIVDFLTRKWAREQDYRLIKEIWAWRENRIAVRFAYEWRDADGNWFRAHGNENWEFALPLAPGPPARRPSRPDGAGPVRRRRPVWELRITLALTVLIWVPVLAWPSGETGGAMNVPADRDIADRPVSSGRP